MRPDDRDIDEEIRGHLAISVHERIERGEDPGTARRNALREFGYVPHMRDSIRRVWYSCWFEAAASLVRETRVGLRSLLRARGLAATVVVTLALGIGANAAIFSVVREVLLRPLVNRDPDRLIYIRQTAVGHGSQNSLFSVPEINDLKSRITTVAAFGDFSTIEFTLVGLGEPRAVRAGVVGGSYFDVMGLRPALGRLIEPADDGPAAAGVAVLTHRFWSESLNGDPAVVGRTIRLGNRPAAVIGVLEPSLPYPADTEIIANVVTSSHHLDATMVTQRIHRMTELFGRLAPGVTLDQARAELSAVHAAMAREHPASYSATANMQVVATPLSDQITAPARTILILLLAAAAIVFVIACANVANLILARTVRRENELALRAALGATNGALRRTLLGESLVLCGAGAVLGIVIARPLVTVVGRFAARFSVRALGVTVDSSLLWIGAGLAIVAAVVLAYVPRLPAGAGTTREKPRAHSDMPAGLPLAGSGIRLTPATNRRLRLFATAQIALSFVLLAAAVTLLAALAALQRANTGYSLRQVLALDLPMPLEAFGPKAIDFVTHVTERVGELPRVQGVAFGNVVPWRDVDAFGPPTEFAVEGRTPADGEEPPHARSRNVTPGFFTALGIPILAGRDFTSDDRMGAELVVMVSQSLAQRMFPDGEALNRRVRWINAVVAKPVPLRIVGVVADVDDEHVVPQVVPTIYHPFHQMPYVRRMFVRTAGDPYALASPVAKIVRELSPDQPVERAITLQDVRAAVLAPERLNAFVVSGFGGIALLIAIVGVAGVLAFSVSARTREFGVRLAIGSSPWHLLVRVLGDGALIVGAGVLAGAVGGYAFMRVAGGYFENVSMPGPVPMGIAAGVLVVAAVIASLLPAARASRVDVLQAIRSE
jgi:predicted permease